MLRGVARASPSLVFVERGTPNEIFLSDRSDVIATSCLKILLVLLFSTSLRFAVACFPSPCMRGRLPTSKGYTASRNSVRVFILPRQLRSRSD